MDGQPNYYAIIPANVRYDKDISANAKLLYGEISSLSNKYGYCIATNEYFSSLYSVSERTVTEWIKSLEEKQYIISDIETKRYDDGTIKKVRKLHINHIEVFPQNHIEENFLYNNTSNINNINKKEIYKEKVFKKPTVEEVKEYCDERNNGINPQQFIDFYESKGWMVGKTKMKDWKACVRTWENNHKKVYGTVAATPVWFEEATDLEKTTEEEQKEMEEILNGIC